MIASSANPKLSYLQEFRFFAHAYRNREERLAQAIVGLLPNSDATRRTSQHILDVGSSDGSLLVAVAGELLRRGWPAPDALALEPDHESFERLKERFGDSESSTHVALAELQERTLQEFLSDSDTAMREFDLILCSHVFYHFAREDWGPFSAAMVSLLSNGGMLVIVLDSCLSPLHSLRPLLTMEACTRHEHLGGDVFGEDVALALRHAGIGFVMHRLESKLVLETATLVAELSRILRFLYRRDPSVSDLDPLTLRALLRVEPSDAAYVVVPWSETVLLLQREGPPMVGGIRG